MGNPVILRALFVLLALFYTTRITNSVPIHDDGRLEVRIFEHSATSPRPLRIAVPTQEGNYPVVVLQHGFQLLNSYYDQLMQQVASHGYIIVAPQMAQSLFVSDATEEIEDAASVLEWIPAHLNDTFPEDLQEVNITPDLNHLVLAGHSRGGKVAFGVALGKANVGPVNLSALAAFDPVDGTFAGQTQPPLISTTSQHFFDLGFPTLIVGTKIGSQGLVPCAPKQWGHEAFYNCSSAPTYHFVAADFGHMDFLDDNVWALPVLVCKAGPSRAPLRNFAGDILVAFLKAALFGDSSVLNDLVQHPENATIALETAESYGVIQGSKLAYNMASLEATESLETTAMESESLLTTG